MLGGHTAQQQSANINFYICFACYKKHNIGNRDTADAIEIKFY
jgi:hypothetical protein